MKLTFNGQVKEGKLHITHRKEFDEQLTRLSGDVELTIQKKRKTRSNPQNRYYWGNVIPICCEILKDCGYLFTHDHTHEFLKANFNTKPLANQKTGEVLSVPISTTELTTVEFEEYMERIRVWAWDFTSVTIPLPNEQTELI